MSRLLEVLKFGNGICLKSVLCEKETREAPQAHWKAACMLVNGFAHEQSTSTHLVGLKSRSETIPNLYACTMYGRTRIVCMEMDGWMDGWMDGMAGWMDVDGSIDRWIDGDGSMDRWIYGPMD